jgi:voltage-gated potassium channel Kch
VIGPRDSRLLSLPGQQQIDRDVQSYRHFLEQEKRDPLETVNPAGKRLFDSLVAPASVPKGAKVVVVPDGSLHNLNFETLPVYGGPLAGARGSVSEMRADGAVPKPLAPIAYAQGSVSGNNRNSNLGRSAETAAMSRRATPASYSGSPHYWLQDATVAIAPSLSVLSTRLDHPARTRSLLLIGNTVTQGTGFAPLPQAALEIEEIKKQFAADRIVAYTGAAATAAAYRAAHPERFSNIHFATHADANEQRPLDSAIILSPEQNTWKLYARDVADIPLHADLVTISACRGAGARTLSGEGLVGFAWAFFQAGARNVVTSLWDVNDRSTADLMDTFYRDIAGGMAYPDALREAKLQMLNGRYRKPYYWGAFQLYSRYLTGRAPKTDHRPTPIESAAVPVHH